MAQHEKLVKDTHDFLAEASEQFKTALTKQVRVMERHNSRHEILKESTAALANTARKRFRDISLCGLSDHSSKDNKDRKTHKILAESMLARADEEHQKSLEEWMEERKVFQEKIKCMDEECKKLKEDREKLRDQVSEHAIRNHKRGQKQVEEKAEVSRIAGGNATLREAALHNDGVEQSNQVKLQALRDLLSDTRKEEQSNQVQLQGVRELLSRTRKERDAALLENQNLKRKREVSTSPPPSSLKLLSRPQGTAAVQQVAPYPDRAELSPAKQPAPKKSRNRKERWANAPTTNAGAPTTSPTCAVMMTGIRFCTRRSQASRIKRTSSSR
jgi:hypothetical protein